MVVVRLAEEAGLLVRDVSKSVVEFSYAGVSLLSAFQCRH